MIKRKLFVIGCALALLRDRLCGRGLAVNEAPVTAAIPGTLPPETPVVTVGIPTNLDAEKVLARKKALIAAGTEPLIAEKFAIDAEQQQYLRDHELTLEAKVETRTAKENVLVIKAHPDGEATEVDLGAMTVADLTGLAAKHEYDLKGATKKADIIAAITAAAKCLVIAFVCALFFGTTAPAQAGTSRQEIAVARAALHLADPVQDVANHVPPSAFLAYLTLDMEVWAGVICALALAFAACAWASKNRLRYRREVQSRFRRALFRIGMFFALIAHRLRGRALATNTFVATPQTTSHGTVSLDGTAAIATKNYVVCRGADDRHFKVGTLITDVPLGVLLNDEIETAEVDVTKKSIALFGLYPEALPAVAAAAIAVDAFLVIDLATPGRVKTLPAAAATYLVIGRSRFTVAAAGDPVSIAHCVPYTVVVP